MKTTMNRTSAITISVILAIAITAAYVLCPGQALAAKKGGNKKTEKKYEVLYDGFEKGKGIKVSKDGKTITAHGIKYNMNGGKAVLEKEDGEEGYSFYHAKGEMYYFDHWNTKANGKGKNVSDEAELTEKEGKKLGTLYAIWMIDEAYGDDCDDEDDYDDEDIEDEEGEDIEDEDGEDVDDLEDDGIEEADNEEMDEADATEEDSMQVEKEEVDEGLDDEEAEGSDTRLKNVSIVLSEKENGNGDDGSSAETMPIEDDGNMDGNKADNEVQKTENVVETDNAGVKQNEKTAAEQTEANGTKQTEDTGVEQSGETAAENSDVVEKDDEDIDEESDDESDYKEGSDNGFDEDGEAEVTAPSNPAPSDSATASSGVVATDDPAAPVFVITLMIAAAACMAVSRKRKKRNQV